MSAKRSRSEQFYGVGAGLVNLYASVPHHPQAVSQIGYISQSISDAPLHVNNFCAISATVDNCVAIGITDVPATDTLAFQPSAPIGPGALNLYGSATPPSHPVARTAAAA